MAPEITDESETPRKVFISSPFSEPRGRHWDVRLSLHNLLSKEPYKPWIYEIEGKKEEEQSHFRKPSNVIIRQAIQTSDVLICFFDQRFGSWMQTASSSGPFHGTDYEISFARQLNKPVLLYRIGDEPQPLLCGFWSLFEDSRILPYKVRRIASDQDLLTVVPSDLADLWSESSPLFRAGLNDQQTTDVSSEIPDKVHLERFRDRLVSARSHGGLSWAESLADTLPLVENSRIPRSLKLTYAGILGDCGNVWANRTKYERAIRAVQLSIKYYLEAGDQEGMFSQVLCLSGILNMANLKRAQHVYRYGSRTVFHMQAFHHMLGACHDNKASILMTAGNWRAAHIETKRALSQSHDVSPYLLSKHAISMAVAEGPAKLDRANTILFEEALPLARRTGRDLGYTLKWAAILALSQNELAQARAMLDEGSKECIRIGNLHTLSDIRAAEAYYQLTAN